MKRFILAVILSLCFIISTFGQGGFGGISLKPERMGNGNMLMFGGGGAWVISEHFYLGGSGFGNVNSTLIHNEELESFGYGSIMLGYFTELAPKFRVGSQINAGSGGYALDGRTGKFRFIEPNVNAWYSINRFTYLNISFNYRFAFTDANAILDRGDLSNLSLQLSLYFGLIKQ